MANTDSVKKQRDEMIALLLEAIEKHPEKWEAGWFTPRMAYNADTLKDYKGLNAIRLSLVSLLEKYQDSRWVTYNQAKKLGGFVKKGEKSKASVTYWTIYDKNTKREFDRKTIRHLSEEEQNEYIRENTYGVFKCYQVFNADQCEGLPKETIKQTERELDEAERNELIETIISNSEAKVYHDTVSTAFYSPEKDEIHMPEAAGFKEQTNYYAAALHEIAHSTGHESRLDRFGDTTQITKESYAVEELRAELAAVFLQLETGVFLEGAKIDNHAAYLDAWLGAVKRDNDIFFKAVNDAVKISDYISANYLKPKENISAADENTTEKEVLSKEEARQKRIREWYSKKKQAQLDVLENNTPLELKEKPNWVAWQIFRPRDGKAEKKLWNPNIKSGEKKMWAKCNDESTWATFEKAMKYARENNCDGLAFALQKEHGISCIDLDGHIKDGVYSEDLKLLLQNTTTFAEESASGNGAHIFLKAKILDGRTQKKNDVNRWECYDDKKFISMTGRSLNSIKYITPATQDTVNLAKAKLGEKPIEFRAAPRPDIKYNVSTQEIVDKIKESKVGGVFEALMKGHDICADHSRSDLKLMNILAFFTHSNEFQMREIFEKSGLYRPEKGEKYVERTIEVACRSLAQNANKGLYRERKGTQKTK